MEGKMKMCVYAQKIASTISHTPRKRRVKMGRRQALKSHRSAPLTYS